MRKALTLLICLGMLLTLAACAGGGKTEAPQEIDLEKIWAKISDKIQIPPMLDLPEDLMLDLCGIRADNITSAKVLICEDSLRTDEVWLIEAKDEASAKDIEKLAQNRLKAKGEESITYSPEQYAVVEKAELVVTGKYVVLFVSPDSGEMAEMFRAEAGI